jgi:hypothetical protein
MRQRIDESRPQHELFSIFPAASMMYGPITAMPEPNVYEFSKHIGAICVRANKNLHTLDAALGINPMLLLRMINGREAPTKAVGSVKPAKIWRSNRPQ